MLFISQQALTASSAPSANFPASNHLLRRSSLLSGAGARINRRVSPVFVSQARNLQEDQQLKLSVIRFTLGIPGLDESYLPRWIGVASGFLILLNHLLTASPSPAQLRSEALGLCLAAFSTALPYIGRFLEGEKLADRSDLSIGNQQIFILSENLSACQREDLAWASYVLLRNTNSMSVLITVQDASCVRGFWNIPEGISKAQVLEWLISKFEEVGFQNLKDTLYFPQMPDSELKQILPRGTLSLLIQPICGDSIDLANDVKSSEGFIVLASNTNYAYDDKDKAWIRAISNKF